MWPRSRSFTFLRLCPPPRLTRSLGGPAISGAAIDARWLARGRRVTNTAIVTLVSFTITSCHMRPTACQIPSPWESALTPGLQSRPNRLPFAKKLPGGLGVASCPAAQWSQVLAPRSVHTPNKSIRLGTKTQGCRAGRFLECQLSMTFWQENGHPA